jgi:5-methyltetrahydrofolate--homocysteine methyltransferase
MDLMTLKQIVAEGEFQAVKPATIALVESGVSVQDILDHSLIPAMENVGERFSAGSIFIPEMMVSAKTMQMALDILRPIMAQGTVKMRGKLAIGTVKDDLHDIGKNIVSSMMQGAGFEVIDLGVDCRPEKYIEAIKNGAKIIGISAILTTVIPNIGKTIKAIEAEGLRKNVAIIIGGAAINENIAMQVGADAYCIDAGIGVVKAKELIEKM